MPCNCSQGLRRWSFEVRVKDPILGVLFRSLSLTYNNIRWQSPLLPSTPLIVTLLSSFSIVSPKYSPPSPIRNPPPTAKQLIGQMAGTVQFYFPPDDSSLALFGVSLTQ